MSAYQTIRHEMDARGVARVMLCRPEVHNAFDERMIAELTELFGRLDKARLVVLSGDGKSFCAGADLAWMRRMKDFSEAENREDSVRLAAMFRVIDRCSAPVIAAVQGAALGGGSGLAAVSDRVVAEEGSQFGFTEVRLGIIPAVISPYVIAKIGVGQARAAFLSGRKFSAEEALRMGLVHRVAQAGTLAAVVEEEIAEGLKAAPQAARAAKRLIREVAAGEVTEPVLVEKIAALRVSEEGQEGMAALLEKRPAAWSKA